MDMSEVERLEANAAEGEGSGPAYGARGEYVTAWLTDEEYGFDSAQVRQIRRFDGFVGHTAPHGFVVGRIGGSPGADLPVVDLRLESGPASVSYTDTMLVVVLASTRGNIGVLVDSISNLVDLETQPNRTLNVNDSLKALGRKISPDPDSPPAHGLVRIPDINHLASCAARH